LPSATDNVLEIEYSVYNRWGAVVFSTDEFNVGWNGMFRGEIGNQAVYVYHGRVTFENGEERTFEGDVTLFW